jgi:deoxyribodipyrimidine photo-lyase
LTAVPKTRIRQLNDEPIRKEGDNVVYWMIANRRSSWNYSLDRAIEISLEFRKPLIVLEALRCGYPWASDRIHRFILQGMADNRKSFADTPVRYYPYVETTAGDGSGLLEALAANAVAVVTDDFPCFFLPRMAAHAADRLPVAMEAVDSNGIVPLTATDKAFARAYDFRRWLQKNITPFLSESPQRSPLKNKKLPNRPAIPNSVLKRWPEASQSELRAEPEVLSRLPIDHAVGPATFDGGTAAAKTTVKRFFADRFERYADERNDPDNEAASGFSPYLHFGHLSVHEILARITKLENWSLSDLAEKANGSRDGWWGMSKPAESFLDELITWRELGYNMCVHRDDYDRYDSLPSWARETLAQHQSDDREHIYDISQFEQARTHDEIWNAAQRQLVRDGRMHNYMRMLWGKKILEWSRRPEDALETMIELNNKYAVDGRNPNSYSGIFWVLGRYDRAWGPERPIFGKIRYMSSDNTARKLKLKSYLKIYGESLFD